MNSVIDGQRAFSVRHFDVLLSDNQLPLQIVQSAFEAPLNVNMFLTPGISVEEFGARQSFFGDLLKEFKFESSEPRLTA